MKILFAAAEAVPFIKTGGLADVVGALAPALAKQGHDVRVIIPKYGQIPQDLRDSMRHVLDFQVQLGWRQQYCGIEEIQRDGVTWYFVDNEFYFFRHYVYGMGGDECERYGFFCRSVLNALPLIGWQPDVIHAHDWQAGMIPALLRIQYDHLPFYHDIRTVYTIHNLQYQGIFNMDLAKEILGLGDEVFTDDKLECYGCANFMKAALVYADEITTVSPSYAEEIQTAYYGERLDGLLRARKDSLSGVLNGIDTQLWNPAVDKMLPKNYTVEDKTGKAVCKAELQRELGLREDAGIPIVSMITRLNSQKGLDLVDHVIAQIMDEGIQLVVLGMGDSRYVNLFSWAEQQYPGMVAARFTMDEGLAHRIYAGSDIFLMPSRFEPCGLSQMISLRYGTIPVVRETGGLRDTVLSYNHYNNAGNGFTFFNYNAHDMLYVLRRAVRYYKTRPDVWATLQQRGMEGDYSWQISANTYENLYYSILPAEKQRTTVAETLEGIAPVKPKRAPRKKAQPEAAEAPADAAPAKPKRAPRKKA